MLVGISLAQIYGPEPGVGPGAGPGAGPGSPFGIEYATGVPLAPIPLPFLVAQIVQYALLLVAVLALAYLVYGGFKYITAAGDENRIEDAKRTITGAIIGLLAIGISFAIVEFVIFAVGGPCFLFC